MHSAGLMHPPAAASRPRSAMPAHATLSLPRCNWHSAWRGGRAPTAVASSATSSASSGVISDSSVPEGHQGLHSSLYGAGGAEQHDSASEYTVRKGEDDGTKLLKVHKYLDKRDGEKPLGVYALYDSAKQVQYVGYSRNMVLAIKGHLQRVGPDKCAYVRNMVFANKAMASRHNLQREVMSWIEEMGQVPPGNAEDQELWEGASGAGAVAVAVMSEVERAEYDNKRLKMKKAMGESLAQGEQGETQGAAERRQNLMAAMQNDDWSAVIDGQTRETIAGAQHPPATGDEASGNGAQAEAKSLPQGPAEQPMVSPFTQASVHRSIGESMDMGDMPTEMTVESVNRALDQVRPYLISDGGNVEVADVSGGIVFLRLEGACNTCSSSATTMRMGIERALQTTFGDQLKEVIQVGQGETSVITVSTVEAHLDKLRGAIGNVGGRVQVVDVQQGTCVIKYAGPEPIGKGVAAAIKDTFNRDIKEVIIIGF